VLFTGILSFFLINGTVQLYLRNRILTISKFNIQSCLDLFLKRWTNLKTVQDQIDDQYYVSTIILNNHLFKSYKIKKSKVFPIIFFVLFLFSFFFHDVYAAMAEFVDGNQFTGLSTNCSSRSTVATLNTSLPAATSSNPNIVIASTDYVSTDTGTEQVDVSSGLYRNTNVLSRAEYGFYIGGSGEGNHYTYLYEDTTAGANPTYTVESCLSATSGNAAAKILAIHGLESSFIDSANVSTTAGSFVTIATLSTDLTANNHIIIAQVQVNFDGTAIIAPGNIELRNSADTMLAENEFEIRGATSGNGSGPSITLIAVVPGGSANTSYKVAVQEPSGGGVSGAEAKILALKADGGEGYFSDGSSVAVATTSTQLTSLSSSFSTSENIAVISASQFDDTDSRAEDLDITTGHEIRENSIAKSSNKMAIGELAASGNAGEGLRHTVIWFGSVAGASLSYDSRADADATGLNGESKLLVFRIGKYISSSDTPTLSESVTLKQNLFPSDTPTFSESVTLKQNLFPSDTPTLSDSATAFKIYSLSADDIPLLSDSATAFLIHILSADDTPALSDSVTVKQKIFPSDTPTLIDSASLVQTFSSNDVPVLSESIILKQSLFPTDVPIINDLAIAQKQITNRGGGGDSSPPSVVSSTLTLAASQLGSVEILGENNDLVNLSETRPIKVGEAINLRFEINEDGGINNLEHASLYIAKGDTATDVSQSNTFIRFEKGSPFKVSDPDKKFSDVSFAILTKDAGSFVLRFDMTFAKPVESSSILFRIWDLDKNSNEIWYQNALEIVDSDSLPAGPSQEPTSQESNINDKNTENDLKTMTEDQKLLVEKWLGYNQESVSDSKLLRLLGIILSQTGEEGNVTIQPWFRNNVGKWLFEGRISFTEFVDALDYMYEKGILR
jgi:hypothetical protein